MASSERVKTYRVLKDGLRHGDSVRNFGDFLPEAKALPTLRTLLNTNVIEEVWVDQEEFEEWEANQAERDEALLAGVDLDIDDDVEEDGEDKVESHPAPAKKVAKKKTAKKTTKKAVVKKGKTSGRKLEQQSV